MTETSTSSLSNNLKIATILTSRLNKLFYCNGSTTLLHVIIQSTDEERLGYKENNVPLTTHCYNAMYCYKAMCYVVTMLCVMLFCYNAMCYVVTMLCHVIMLCIVIMLCVMLLIILCVMLLQCYVLCCYNAISYVVTML